MSSLAYTTDEYYALVHVFPLIPLRNQRQYKAALKMVDKLTDAPETITTAQLDYLSVLGRLVTDYEKEHLSPMPDVSGQELLVFLMQQHNLTLTSLAKEVGAYKSNLSGFLNGTRSLSKKLALALAKRFQINVELLLRT